MAPGGIDLEAVAVFSRWANYGSPRLRQMAFERPRNDRIEVFGPDLADRGRADERHRPLELGIEDLEHPGDADLPEGPQPPDLRAADASHVRADRQRLEHVGTAADAAVEQHRHRSANRFDHLL